ncbi:MAG TPA: fatty acid desaturase, partial [Terrimicrobiaceae bacterium]
MSQQTPLTAAGIDKSRSKDGHGKALTHAFKQPSLGRSTWQVANSVGSYILLWGLMYLVSAISYWLIVPLAILGGGLLVRIFVIFHDCTHNSFFRSRKANGILGFITGVLCFTPYEHWKWEHTIHHAHAGDLDSRGLGDVWTLTVDEYLRASRFTRLRYRLNRNPLFLFLVAPLFLFLVLHRIPSSKATAKARRSVHYTTAAIILLAGTLIWIFGWRAYLLIQGTGTFVAAVAGVWLFYIQHQFEGVAWERKGEWDFTQAALEGSSFYKLPKILQW